MILFALLDRFWQLFAACYIIIAPKALDIILDIQWYDALIWFVESIIVLTECYVLYLVFIIIFLKPIPNINDFNQFTRKQTVISKKRDYFMLLHVYHAMLAYATSTIVIAILIVVINSKFFYQNEVTLYFAIFGDDLICEEFKEYSESYSYNCETDSNATEIESAYYYVAIVMILTLGRSHRISLLWRIMCEISDTLVVKHAKYAMEYSDDISYENDHDLSMNNIELTEQQIVDALSSDNKHLNTKHLQLSTLNEDINDIAGDNDTTDTIDTKDKTYVYTQFFAIGNYIIIFV